MDIRHLRYFMALWEARSFTRAASLVHVAQSTLSHQIRQLENELGQPLFFRTEQGVVGTPAGKIFHAHALLTLQSLDRSIAAMKSIPKELTGKLELAVTPTCNIDLVPQAVAAFVERHPLVRVLVSERTSREVAEDVQQGRQDVGIAYRPDATSGTLAFEPLFDDELVVLVSPEHPLAARKRLRMIDLHHLELVLQPKTCTTRHIVDTAFASVQAQPNVAVEMGSLSAIKSLVKRSKLAGILSRLAVKDSDDLVMLAIEGPALLRVPGFITRQDHRSFLLSSFCATVRAAVMQGQAPPGPA